MISYLLSALLNLILWQTHWTPAQTDLKNFYKHFSNYTFYSTRSLTSLKKSNLALFGIADLHTSRENLSSKQDKQKRG